jgi:hypothetical protein
MGLLDKVKGMLNPAKAKELAADHGDQIVKGVDKATDAVDDKTKGKFTDKLEKVDDAAEKAVDKLDGDR